MIGCIIHGHDEVADADFGYVGSKPGKIDLYVGEKMLLLSSARSNLKWWDESLIVSIKRDERWIETAEF